MNMFSDGYLRFSILMIEMRTARSTLFFSPVDSVRVCNRQAYQNIPHWFDFLNTINCLAKYDTFISWQVAFIDYVDVLRNESDILIFFE